MTLRGRVAGYEIVWTTDVTRELCTDFCAHAREVYRGHGCEGMLPDPSSLFAYCLVFRVGEPAMVAGFAIRRRRLSELNLELFGSDQGVVRDRTRCAIGAAETDADPVVLEAVSAWTRGDQHQTTPITPADVLAAQPTLAMMVGRTSHMVALSADHAAARWIRSGARPVEPVLSAGVPAGYATQPLVWRLSGMRQRMDGLFFSLLRAQVSSSCPLAIDVLNAAAG